MLYRVYPNSYFDSVIIIVEYVGRGVDYSEGMRGIKTPRVAVCRYAL